MLGSADSFYYCDARKEISQTATMSVANWARGQAQVEQQTNLGTNRNESVHLAVAIAVITTKNKDNKKRTNKKPYFLYY
jgi:hypothetical protein